MDYAKIYETSLKMRDGVSLYYRVSTPSDMKAIIVFVHGVGEHSGRYDYLAQKMNDAGYGVVRFDLRGHGKSGGERGFVKDFHEFPEDVNEVVLKVEEDFADVPLYMLGHSMGSLIAALYAMSFPSVMKGQILSAFPAIELPFPTIRLLKKLPYEKLPKIRLANDLAKFISRDPQVVADYIADPLNLKKATIKMSAEMFIKAPVFIEDHVWEYELPCLLLHGGADEIVTPLASEWFFDKIASPDKTRKVYPGLFHEIYNEKEKEEVIADTIAWLDAR